MCGGDGSIGWVLSEIDKLELRKQVRPIIVDSLNSEIILALYLHENMAI